MSLNKRTTSITKLNTSLYLLLPKSIVKEKDIKSDDEFVALKTKHKDNVSFKRISSEVEDEP